MREYLKKTLPFSLLAVFSLLVVWTVACLLVRNEYILPSISDVFAEMGRLLSEGDFYVAFCFTLLRTLICFVISAVLGVGLALLSALFWRARAFLSPVISVLRTLPTMAFILILLIWTTPLFAPVVVTGLVLFPAIYAAALAAFDGVWGRYGELCEAYKVPLYRRAFRMFLPLSAPNLLGQAGAMLSMGLKVTVSSEVLAKTFQSLGGMMQEAQIFYELPRLFALTLFAVLTGFLLEALGGLLRRRLNRGRV